MTDLLYIPSFPKYMYLAFVLFRGTGKRPSHRTRLVRIRNIDYTCVRTTNQYQYPNNKDKSIDNREAYVLCANIPFTFLDNSEPEKSWEIETEATDEETRNDSQKRIEERHRLRSNPGYDRKARYQHQPDRPAFLRVHVADLGFGEHAAHDVFADNSGIDAPGDENDGERQTKCYARDQSWGGKNCGAGNIAADEGVDDCSCEGVDEYLDETERPDGFDVVARCVHLGHEAVLADGERVGKDYVGCGKEDF